MHVLTGRPTVQPVGSEGEEPKQQGQNGPTVAQPQEGQGSQHQAAAPSHSSPDKAPADAEPVGNPADVERAHSHGAVATAADAVANFSYVGENQPVPERDAGDAGVPPVEQAITAKVGVLTPGGMLAGSVLVEDLSGAREGGGVLTEYYLEGSLFGITEGTPTRGLLRGHLQGY